MMPAKAKPRSKAKSRTKAEETAAVWAEVVEELEALANHLAAGGTWDDAGLRTTTYRLPPPPPEYGPDRVRALRERLGADERVFADILGATATAVRSWERGTKPPPPMARRLLAEVEANPAKWQVRFATPGKPSAREGS